MGVTVIGFAEALGHSLSGRQIGWHWIGESVHLIETVLIIHSVPRVVLTFKISNLGKIYIFRPLMT